MEAITKEMYLKSWSVIIMYERQLAQEVERFNQLLTKSFTISEKIDKTTFCASNIDFNIADHPLFYSSIKYVTFQSGQLAGYELRILDWDNTIKQITLEVWEGNGGIFPGDINFAIGDKFIINMFRP